jgi:hypothetical protein
MPTHYRRDGCIALLFAAHFIVTESTSLSDYLTEGIRTQMNTSSHIISSFFLFLLTEWLLLAEAKSTD